MLINLCLPLPFAIQDKVSRNEQQVEDANEECKQELVVHVKNDVVVLVVEVVKVLV